MVNHYYWSALGYATNPDHYTRKQTANNVKLTVLISVSSLAWAKNAPASKTIMTQATFVERLLKNYP
jgi:hypothetical protein